MRRSLAALLLVSLIAAGTSAWAGGNPSARLAAAINKWEAFERHEFPEQASLRGQHQADDRLTDLSDAAVFARRRQVAALLAELRSIGQTGLAEQEQVSKEMLTRRLAQLAQVAAIYGALPFGPFGSDSWLPLSSLGGPHSGLVVLAQASRFEGAQDYRNYLTRLEQVPGRIRDMITRMQLAIKAGWIGPAAPMERVPEQLAGFSTDGIVNGPLMAPFNGRLRGVSEGEGQELTARARAVLGKTVAPAFAELKRFFEENYLPAARAVPLSASRLPAGNRYYDTVAGIYTTTSEKPEKIHEIGLAEVTRIGAEIQRILDSVGFAGKLRDFVSARRADPVQQFASTEALLTGYRGIAKRADAELPSLFAELPRMPYGIRAMEAFEGDNAEHYIPGSGDGTRSGYFMANVNRLDRRGRFEMESVLLHEAVPGHHLQIARAMELKAIPEFRRHAWIPAYGEGWALYAESLGEQMGFYQTPEAKINRLSMEMWRACRLVVDTGLHRYDWTRQQAIDYMVDNAGLETGVAAAEVDRYISVPGQALAYKMGELKIKSLRDHAKSQLGDKFDLRRFHNAVLDDGALPLDLLQQRVERWIRRERARKAAKSGAKP